MRNLKKIISLVLALMMVLSVMVTANAAFADEAEIDAGYVEAVEVMAAIGVLQGDGTNFNPNGTLNRAEAAVILSKAHSGRADVKHFEDETKYTENPFSDVSGWALPYVLYCYQNEIVGGTSATTYAPSKSLTGYEFAKMLLVAAGFGKHADYVGDETQTWEQKTMLAAKEEGLLDGLTITLKNPITREQASQMALNAMMAGGETVITYYVYTGDTLGENVVPAPVNTLLETSDYLEAFVMASVVSAKLQRFVDTTGSLLADKYGVIYTPASKGAEDTYGRSADEYLIPNVYGGYDPLYYPVAALATYTGTTKAATVAADLVGYKTGAYAVNADTTKISVNYTYDLHANGVNTTETETVRNFAAELAALTGPNTVVEVYGDPSTKQITEVVVVTTYATEVSEIKDADEVAGTPEYAVVAGQDIVNVAGYKQFDVVTYTIDKTGAVDNVAAAVGAFEGVLTSYTNIGDYTINGTVYTMHGNANAAKAVGTLASGDKKIYYPGTENTIIYVDDMPGEAPVVLNDYAYVLETYTVCTPVSVYPVASYSWNITLKVLLTDGTVDYWSLPVVIKNNQYGYYLNGTFNPLTPGNSVATDLLDGLANRVYTYADKALVADVTDKASADVDFSGMVDLTSSETIAPNATYVVDSNVYLNENTVFVMQDGNGGYTTKTGVKNLTETLDSALYILANKTYIAAINDSVYVASVVYALSETVDSSAVMTTDVVYNTGVYSTSVDAKGEEVYTYTVVDAKGNYGTAIGDGENTGLYVLTADGALGDSTGFTGTVTAISGSTVVLSGTHPLPYVVVNANTVIHDVSIAGRGLRVGASILFVDVAGDGVIELIYVVG